MLGQRVQMLLRVRRCDFRIDLLEFGAKSKATFSYVASVSLELRREVGQVLFRVSDP